MVWRILVAVAALAIFSGGDACAQATNGVPPTPPDHAAPDQPQIVVECIAIRELHEKIIVGRRGNGIILWLGGGACNAPGSSGISDLSAGFATDGGMEDVVEGENCPAFQKRINKLWAARQHPQHGYGTIPDVRAGPFTITDTSDLFQLQSPEGRRAAARWISQTLVAVRPCWDTIRDDRTHYVVDLLYSDLRRSAQAAIDAAVGQDERQEYKRLHALSPEAQAERDENQQLKAATTGRQTAAADQPRRMRLAGRPWIEITGVTVNKIDIASNGPQASADVTIILKNVGSIATSYISSSVELMGFSRIQDMSPARIRINSCYHADKFPDYKTERAVEPGAEVPIDVSIEKTDAFWPWNSAYNGADFLVAIGCVNYSLGPENVRGTSAFAYVIGKKVNGKLAPLGEGDGVVTTKNVSWRRLHQDYEQ